MDDNPVDIHQEIEDILQRDYNEMIEENKSNVLIDLLSTDQLDSYSIDELIEKIN